MAVGNDAAFTVTRSSPRPGASTSEAGRSNVIGAKPPSPLVSTSVPASVPGASSIESSLSVPLIRTVTGAAMPACATIVAALRVMTPVANERLCGVAVGAASTASSTTMLSASAVCPVRVPVRRPPTPNVNTSAVPTVPVTFSMPSNRICSLNQPASVPSNSQSLAAGTAGSTGTACGPRIVSLPSPPLTATTSASGRPPAAKASVSAPPSRLIITRPAGSLKVTGWKEPLPLDSTSVPNPEAGASTAWSSPSVVVMAMFSAKAI